MTISLPTIISEYLAASDRGDLDAVLACFTEDAVVLDEDREWVVVPGSSSGGGDRLRIHGRGAAQRV